MKAHSTKVFEYCAREAAQIFGGASYVRGGQGEKVRCVFSAPACGHCRADTPAAATQVERLYREVRAYAIPGGSEEILLDLSVRQAMKDAKLAKL
jgi:alkylation response protein AidB-like acyl-CoA dehydrogenase